MEILCGVVTSIIYRNLENGYSVLALEDESGDEITAVGVIPLANEGERIELNGDFVVHRVYGRQFKALECKVLEPTSLDSIVAYLAGGFIKGVGIATAKTIVTAFGMDTLDILDKEPFRLTEIPGIGKTRAAQISESYKAQREMRDTIISLEEFDVTTSQALKLYKKYGSLAATVIKENPYRLIDDIDNIGFKIADKIAYGAGISGDSEFRVTAGIKYVLNLARREGHTFLPRPLLISTTTGILSTDELVVSNCLDNMITSRILKSARMGETVGIFAPVLYYEELGCATMLRLLNDTEVNAPLLNIENEITALENERNIKLAPTQREAITMALTSGAMVITGGPGTGKTTILQFIIGVLEKSDETYALAAPTGRAAKRMSEATATSASTIHRLLEYSFQEHGFMRNEEDPIEKDVIIVDEMSMVDVPLMYALLKAIKPGSRLIMVGDADQLPPVGAGNVLRDILRSKTTATIRLTEIFRQTERSMIVSNAHSINHGQMPVLSDIESDFIFEEIDYANDILNRIVGITTGKIKLLGTTDPFNDVQVLVPMKKGILGVYNINETLQKALNPKSPEKKEWEVGSTIFREGDKIMQIKNDYSLNWTYSDRYGVIDSGYGVFNGDIGTIMEIDHNEHLMTILFDDNREVQYEAEQLDELTLAYCISIHKSQGNEFPIVLLPLINGTPLLYNRNLLYTAITRARKQVCILGHRDTVIRMVENTLVKRRYSALSRMLLQIKNFTDDDDYPEEYEE
ncbi:MAG: ATP-dependent RecD-like DNA helicase [Clostridia bacterium]